MVHGVTRRCFRRCGVPFVLVLVVVSAVLSLVIFVVIQLHPLFVRRQLLNLAGGRRLLTFHSTPNWGIGNAMFAFSSTLAIAGTDSSLLLCFDGRLQLRSAFPALADWPSCSPHDLLDGLRAERLKEVAHARYDIQLPYDLPRDRHVVLDRYLQSWKYFAGIDARLRRIFRFNDNVLSAASKAARIAADDDVEPLKVGLHVRRGDMEKDDWLRRIGHVVADMSYIERAMDYMDRHLRVDKNTGRDAAGRRRVFIVCSNDMDWCREHMPTHRLQHVEFLSTQDPVVDLAVLASCHHSIITVGSYGWWAAWLANGTTVYYKAWPRQGSLLDADTSHDDYFPPHWIPL